MIVIDVGCASFEGARSIPELIVRFRPDAIYAFDPNSDEVAIATSVPITRSYAAAWTYDGTVGFHRDSTCSYISESDTNWPQVECVDLARVIRELLPAEIVLKLDCEGSEYGLLRHLRRKGLDKRLALVLVEWHGEERVELRCPVEEWSA